MSRNYRFHNKAGVYFVSFSTVYWVDIFVREVYFQILIDSLAYCRKEKDILIHAYVIMSNHVHLIFRAQNENPTDFIRDFKRFTSYKLIKTIKANKKESRRHWLIKKFIEAGRLKTNIPQHQFWQHHNHQKLCWNNRIFMQKLNYLHNNPVKSGFVTKPEDWKYSSARNYLGDQSVLEIDILPLV